MDSTLLVVITLAAIVAILVWVDRRSRSTRSRVRRHSRGDVSHVRRPATGRAPVGDDAGGGDS